MKAVVLCLCYLILLWSCKHTHVVTKSNSDVATIKLHEGIWYSNFKNEVFIRCVRKLYPQSVSSFIDSSDASSSANTEWLEYNSEVLTIVDSLANEFVKRPELSRTIENKKVILNVCMGYRNSVELDAAAVFFYRKYGAKK